MTKVPSRLRLDLVALAVAALVAIFGIAVFTHERENRIERDRELACALSVWNSRVVNYFQFREQVLTGRIGTAAEVEADRVTLVQIRGLLTAAGELNAALGVTCDTPPSKER